LKSYNKGLLSLKEKERVKPEFFPFNKLANIASTTKEGWPPQRKTMAKRSSFHINTIREREREREGGRGGIGGGGRGG